MWSDIHDDGFEHFCDVDGFFLIDPAPSEIYTLSLHDALPILLAHLADDALEARPAARHGRGPEDRKSTRLNSSHQINSYAVFCLKKKNDRRQATYVSYRNS